MGNKIYKQSQMPKATAECESANYSKALQILKEEQRSYPRSQEALRLQFRVLFRLYDLDKVEEMYAKFYSSTPLQQEDVLTKAILVKETMFYEESKARGLAKELASLVERSKYAPTLLQSQFHGSVAQQQQLNLTNINASSAGNNNNLSAITESSQQTDSAVSFARAVLLLLDSQFEEAISIINNDILSQGANVSPTMRFDSQVIIALSYNKLKLFKKTLTLINDMTQSSSGYGSSRDKMFELNAIHGETLAGLSKVEESIEKYTKCLETIPTNNFIIYRLYTLCVRMGDLRGSRSFLDRSLKVRPNDSLCSKMQGDQCLLMKDTKNAIKMYEKGVSVNKKCYRCFESLGDVSSENLRLGFYEKCAKSNPYYTDVMIKIGIHYMQHSDDFLEALRWFFKALEFKSTHKLIYFYIARSFYQNDQYEYALKNLAVSLDLTYEKINDQLSLAVKILNRYAELFKKQAIVDFIESIRFKYFQYFLTISQNLENVAFSKLFTGYVAPTQLTLQFCALNKIIGVKEDRIIQIIKPRSNYSNSQDKPSLFSQISIVDNITPTVAAALNIKGTQVSGSAGTNTAIIYDTDHLAQKYFLELLKND